MSVTEIQSTSAHLFAWRPLVSVITTLYYFVIIAILFMVVAASVTPPFGVAPITAKRDVIHKTGST